MQFGYVFNFVELRMFGILWVMVTMYVSRIDIKQCLEFLTFLTLEEKCQFATSICDYKTIATNICY